MNDDPAPVSSRNDPVAESDPMVMLTAGVLSKSCCGDSVRSGFGPMNGLSSSIGPDAPAGVTDEYCEKGAYGNFPRRLGVGMPGLGVCGTALNGVPGL